VKEQQIVGRKTKTIIKNRCNWKNIEKRKRDEDYSAEKRPAYGVESQSRRRYSKISIVTSWNLFVLSLAKVIARGILHTSTPFVAITFTTANRNKGSPQSTDQL
jgi:hypothetical protein